MTDEPDEAARVDEPERSVRGGSSAAVVSRSAQRRGANQSRRVRQQRRYGRLMLIGGAAILLITGVVLLITALKAKSELAAVRADLTALRAQISARDTTQLTEEANSIAGHARSAYDLTSGPVWDVLAAVPWLGDPFETAQGIAEVADRLGSSTVPELVDLAKKLDPDKIRDSDGRFDLAAINRSAPTIQHARNTTRAVTTKVAALPSSTWLSGVDDGRAELLRSLTQLSGALDRADQAARLLPPMLGQDRPQRYFLGFVNEAELRGTGGLPGAFAIARASHGLIKIERFLSDNALGTVQSGVRFDRDYDALYSGSQSTNIYVNSTMSPDFSRVAQIWAGFWRAKTGQRIDGAIAVDPTALGYFLGVTGPTRLADGTAITAQNVVALTQKDVYARFPGDASSANNSRRRQFLLRIAKAVEQKVLDSSAVSDLAKAGERAAGQRRLAIWARDPASDAVLQETSFGGRIPNNPGPFAGPVYINAAAGKLDYYLQRRFEWRTSSCGQTRRVTATMTITNGAPRSGLPPYVVVRSDKRLGTYTPGDNHLLIQYYATAGATLKSATIDGKPASFGLFSEAGHPVYVGQVEIGVGRTRTITLEFEESGPYAPVTVLDQPGVIPQEVTVRSVC